MKLLIASNNPHKYEEIISILDLVLGGKIEVLTPDMVINYHLYVEENSNTLEGNAKLKAETYCHVSNLPCIADDTGLEIEALNGDPGIHSARFSGIHGNDILNRKKVLELMKNVPFSNRRARFRTVICYFDKNIEKYIEGICTGYISLYEKGKNGFGYDSIFIPDGFNITFAEMESSIKNSISHRGKAIENLIEFLKSI